MTSSKESRPIYFNKVEKHLTLAKHAVIEMLAKDGLIESLSIQASSLVEDLSMPRKRPVSPAIHTTKRPKGVSLARKLFT